MKHTSNEANDLIHKTVDTANDIVKSVSGKGGLVGKASDTSSNILKNVSSTGNKAVGKTADTSSKAFKNTKQKFSKKNK